MTKVILYGIMFIAFFGMLWANSQYKRNSVSWGRPLAALCGVFSLLMALVVIIMQLTGGVNEKEIDDYRKKEARYQFIAHKKMGQLIAENHPGEKILLIKDRDTPEAGVSENVITEAIEGGLKEGLAGKAQIAAEEGVSLGYSMEDDMMTNELTAKKFDTFLKRHKDCKVILLLVELPMDYQLMSFWQMKDASKRPALYLINSRVYDMKEAIAAKFINGALVNQPLAVDITKDVPEDEDEAFDLRFILITPENVRDVARKHNNIFASSPGI